jgi:hypothetical protein
MVSSEKIRSTRLFSLRSLIQLSTVAEMDRPAAGLAGFCGGAFRAFLTTRIGSPLEFLIFFVV